jgi:hypothetical protein
MLAALTVAHVAAQLLRFMRMFQEIGYLLVVAGDAPLMEFLSGQRKRKQ